MGSDGQRWRGGHRWDRRKAKEKKYPERISLLVPLTFSAPEYRSVLPLPPSSLCSSPIGSPQDLKQNGGRSYAHCRRGRKSLAENDDVAFPQSPQPPVVKLLQNGVEERRRSPGGYCRLGKPRVEKKKALPFPSYIPSVFYFELCFQTCYSLSLFLSVGKRRTSLTYPEKRCKAKGVGTKGLRKGNGSLHQDLLGVTPSCSWLKRKFCLSLFLFFWFCFAVTLFPERVFRPFQCQSFMYLVLSPTVSFIAQEGRLLSSDGALQLPELGPSSPSSILTFRFPFLHFRFFFSFICGPPLCRMPVSLMSHLMRIVFRRSPKAASREREQQQHKKEWGKGSQ